MSFITIKTLTIQITINGIAILLGIFFGNFFKIRESFQKGLDFSRDYILKLGIICLGIQLNPFEFLEFGKIAIPLILICIVSVLIVIKLIIKKLHHLNFVKLSSQQNLKQNMEIYLR